MELVFFVLRISLDIFVVFAELLIVEPELVHKVGRHLLDLIVREGLRGCGGRRKSAGSKVISPPAGSSRLVLLTLPAAGTGRWGRGSPCRRLRWTSACCGCSPASHSTGIHSLTRSSVSNWIPCISSKLVKPAACNNVMKSCRATVKVTCYPENYSHAQRDIRIHTERRCQTQAAESLYLAQQATQATRK